MKKSSRKIIYIIFVILFFITIPTTLIYTAGYRYNFKKNKLEKTGALLTNTITKDTTLYINNKPYYNKDIFRISNILPGEYSIKIEKDGYYSWNKKINIESKLSTFIKDIRLFKKTLPINIINKNILSIFPNYDNKKMIYTTKDNNLYNAWLLPLNSNEPKKIFSSIYEIQKVEWSAGDNIVIETTSQFRIFDTKNSEIIINLPEPINKMHWDSKNKDTLYTLRNDGIYKIDLFFKNYKKIYNLTGNVKDFAVLQDTLYLLENYNLKQINIKEGGITTIPLERKDYFINNIIDKKIHLLSTDNKLQIFNLPLSKSSTPILLTTAKDFSIRGNDIIFYDDFEIWTYNFDTNKKNLITRIGLEIKKADWLDNNIIFISGNQLKAIELSETEKQVINLIKFENLNSFIISENYTLFFTGEVNQLSGIYKLEI